MSDCLHCDIHDLLESHLQGEQADLTEIAAKSVPYSLRRAQQLHLVFVATDVLTYCLDSSRHGIALCTFCYRVIKRQVDRSRLIEFDKSTQN
jgi:hypothetical protein